MGPVAQGTMHPQVNQVLGGNLHLNYSLKQIRKYIGNGKNKVKFHFGYYFDAQHGIQYLLLSHLDPSPNEVLQTMITTLVN